jgi:hypothetical protein
MAEQFPLRVRDQLRHFISAATWDAVPLLKELVCKANRPLGCDDAALVVDDAALPSWATHRLAWRRHKPRRSTRRPTARARFR